ncbi:MAG: hypothetical protein L0G25_01505 [Psychrobacter sp.]|nr:hypothetical protein [Psychrobacter sp.]
MQILSKYSPWQIEMAVTASLLKLGSLSDKQIVEYTHYLLDNEYYDDEMLAIIDDDPIQLRGTQDSFRRAISNLYFPEVTAEQAKWVYTCLTIYEITVQPENYHRLDNGQAGLHYIFEGFFEYNDDLKDVDGFTDALYCINEASGDVYMGYVQYGYNDPKTIFAMKIRFFDLCQQWIDRNQHKIASIFATLYP